jgi:ribonuclease HI
MSGAPQLEPGCGSWVIVCRHTRNAVRETFDKRLADRVANEEADRFEVLTTLQWLREFNARIKT